MPFNLFQLGRAQSVWNLKTVACCSRADTLYVATAPPWLKSALSVTLKLFVRIFVKSTTVNEPIIS